MHTKPTVEVATGTPLAIEAATGIEQGAAASTAAGIVGVVAGIVEAVAGIVVDLGVAARTRA